MAHPFWKAGIQAVGATGVRAVSSLAIQKLMALWFGPLGITLLNHLQNLTALLVSVPNDGINRGLSALLPSATGPDRELIKLVGWFWHSLMLILAIILVVSFPEYTIKPFAREMSQGQWLGWFIPSIAGYFAFSLWCGFRLAEGEVATYSYVQGLTAVVTLAIAGLGLLTGKVDQMLAYIVVGQGMGGLVAWLHQLSRKPQTISLSAVFSAQFSSKVKAVGAFGLMALGITLFGRLTDFGVRQFGMIRFDELEIGYWQSVARLSDAYFLPLNTFLTAVVFPHLSAEQGVGLKTSKGLFRALGMALPLSWAGLLLLWLLRSDVLVMLNDIEFTNASSLCSWQFMGDALRVPAYIFSTFILSRNKPMVFLGLEASSTVVYLASLWLLLPVYETTGFVMAHLIRYCFYLPATLYVASRLKA